MKQLAWFLLLVPILATGQTVPALDWQSMPLAGPAELRGVVSLEEGLLAWGDAGPDSGRSAVATLASSEDGQPNWVWTDPRSGRSRFHAAAEGSQGVLFAGEAARAEGTSHALLVMMDLEGDTSWTSEEQWGGISSLHGLAPCAAGGWIAAGERSHDALLVRLDGSGDTLWTRSFEFHPDYDDVFYDVAELPDGRLVACGQTFHDWHEWTSRYAVLAWFSADGQLLDLYSPYDAQMFSLDLLNDGRVAVTGDYQFAYLPIWLCNGSQSVTYRQFGTMDRNMMGHDIRACPDGGLALAGRWQTAAGEMANLLMRLDTEGDELWRVAFHVCGIDIAKGLARMVDGSYRLAGSCMPSRTPYLLGTTSELETSAPSPAPRPEAMVTLTTSPAGMRVRWSHMAGRPLQLQIFNLLGQVAWELVPAGSDGNELVIPLSGLPSGRYLLSVESAAGAQTLPFNWLP